MASVKGLELEGQFAVTPQDRINYALALLDAHYVRYSPNGLQSWAGRKLDRAPSHALTLGYEHGFVLDQGRLIAGVSARRSGDSFISVPAQLLQYRVPARTESDASLRYQPQRAPWSVQARVKNIENKVRPISIDSFGMTVPSDPRTFDVRVDYRF